MKKYLKYYYYIPIVWLATFFMFLSSCMHGRMAELSALILIICTFLQLMALFYEYKLKQHWWKHLFIILIYFVLITLTLYFEPFLLGGLKNETTKVFMDTSTSDIKVYDYYDTVVPCYSDTMSWLVLKEGETGYYYYDYYHPKLDSATISFSINDIGIPTKTIYSRQVSVCSGFDEFGVLYRDSFVVISEDTENPFPALFTVIVQTGNNQTEEQRMKCCLHHWHR